MGRIRIFLAIALSTLVTATFSQETLLFDNGQFFTENSKLYEGSYTTYHENGKKSAIYSLENGVLNGKAQFFFEDGANQEMGSYKAGEKHGNWVRWSETGMKIGEISYYLGDNQSQIRCLFHK